MPSKNKPDEGERELKHIAKYRDHERPGKWYLTDFTMEQVERRLNYLEEENKRLRESRPAERG